MKAPRAAKHSEKAGLLYYDAAEAFSIHGDADRAYESSLLAIRDAGRRHDPKLTSAAMEQLTRHAWAAAKCAQALPIVEAYVRRRAGSASSPKHLSALLGYAHLLTTTGHAAEALKVLDEAAAFKFAAHLDSVARLLSERAYALAQLGFDVTETYERALELVRKTDNSRLLAAIINNFAVHARNIGDIERAFSLHQEVTALADRVHIHWRAHYYILSHGLTSYFAGHLNDARSLLLAGSTRRPDNNQVGIAQATLGLLVGTAIGEADLVARYSDMGIVDAVTKSGEPSKIANLFAAMHRHLVRAGDIKRADALLNRSLPIITNPYNCGLLFLEIASHGFDDVLKRSIEQNARLSQRSRIRHAFDRLLHARVLSIHGDKRALHEADRAAFAFEELHWSLHRATALELAERPGEASKLYALCEARADERRLRARRRRPGRPRQISGQLTPRQWEVAKLCVTGLRNHEIAMRLGVGIGTVEFHVRNILRELNVTSRYELRDILADLR